MNKLIISGSPHIHDQQSVKSIMYGVVLAMIPAMLVSFYFFGLDAARVIFFSVAGCLMFEYLIQRFIMKEKVTVTDGSAIVTGVLLAFNVPSNLPLWIILIGALVSIGIGKMSFGGIGKNPFNPALVGRVFLMISFPVQMTSWPVPRPLFADNVTDAITGPTPLGILKEGLSADKTIQEIMTELPGYIQLLIGNHGGSLGEVSALALLIGALFMFIRKIITWPVPTSYIGSVVIFSGILWLVDPSQFADPLFHLFTGGMMLGVFYMATDMVTSPMSNRGQLIFGTGAGILTMLIRLWGAYPEGVSFAILIMNAFVPLINRYSKPKQFGEVLKHG